MSDIVDNRAQREEVARLHEAAREAGKTLQLVFEYGEIVRCAKSGIPIAHGDETVADDETGEVWLRSALGLPPRPEPIEDDDHVDDDNHFDEGA